MFTVTAHNEGKESGPIVLLIDKPTSTKQIHTTYQQLRSKFQV